MPYLFKKTCLLSAKFITFLMKGLFGSEDTVVDSYLEDAGDNKGVVKLSKVDKDSPPRISIRGVQLGHTEVSFLFLLIVSFLLLAGVTAWDVFFLEETYVCSEELSIYCFPLDIDNAAVDFEINFTEAQEHRITNCSFWESEELSGRVTLLCFHWVLNSKAILSMVGGLLTIFVLSMKVLGAALIMLSKAFIEGVSSLREKSRFVNFICSCKMDGCLRSLRVTILLIVAVLKVCFVLIGYTFV